MNWISFDGNHSLNINLRMRSATSNTLDKNKRTLNGRFQGELVLSSANSGNKMEAL